MSGLRAGEEGAMNWEFGIDVYALPCIKQRASGNLLSGSSARCSVATEMGGMRGCGREVDSKGWEYMRCT